MIFRVLNRENDQGVTFGNEDDYAALLRLFGRTQDAAPMRGLPECLPEWTPVDEMLIEFERVSDGARRTLCALTEQSVTHDIGSRPSGIFR